MTIFLELGANAWRNRADRIKDNVCEYSLELIIHAAEVFNFFITGRLQRWRWD